MRNIINSILIVCAAIFAVACTPMDDNFKDFVEDGPVTYLTKLEVEEVTIIGERNRAQIILPRLYDLRAKNVVVYWSNRTKDTTQPINPGDQTSLSCRNQYRPDPE